jgi:hypothetical protein
VNQALMKAQCTDHCDGLASLVWQLDSHSLFYPQSARGHPQVKRCFIYVDDVVLRLLHEDFCYVLGELLLLVFQLHLPCNFGAIDNLRLSVSCSMLQVKLPDGPGG